MFYHFKNRSLPQWLLVTAVLFPYALFAQQTEQKTQRKPSLEERVDILEEEVEQAKMKKAAKEFKSVMGMGPSASAIYHVEDGFSFGGYAEITGESYKSRYRTGVGDVKRLILYTGYRFTDNILFNAEIEYEHAGFERHDDVVNEVDYAGRETQKKTVQGGAAMVEFAYVEFRIADWLQIRPGLNLVPIGITNWMHEPNTFYSVNRPATEQLIIPTTWRELGVLFTGEIGRFQYRTGLLSGLDASQFTASEYIGEDGSYRGSEASLRDGAFILNVDANLFDGFTLGGSYYAGRAGQGNVTAVQDNDRLITPDGTSLGFSPEDTADMLAIMEARRRRAPVLVQMAEGHFLYRTGPWDFRVLAVRSWMSEEDTRAVNRATGENVGMIAEGGYLEAGFNVLSFWKTDQKLMLFVRNEFVNTQRKTVERKFGGKEDVLDAVCEGSSTCKTTTMFDNGNQDLGIIEAEDANTEAYGKKGLADKTNDRRILTVGLAYFPHPNVTVKVEYAKNDSKSDWYRDQEVFNPENNKIDTINVGIGVVF